MLKSLARGIQSYISHTVTGVMIAVSTMTANCIILCVVAPLLDTISRQVYWIRIQSVQVQLSKLSFTLS